MAISANRETRERAIAVPICINLSTSTPRFFLSYLRRLSIFGDLPTSEDSSFLPPSI